MNQQADPLQGEVRFKVPLPIVIPIGGLLLIAAVTIFVSRILLSVPKEVSVVIALAIAANVLIACAVIALRPQETRNSWAELLVVATYPLVIGIVLANIGLGESTHAGEAHGAAEEAAAEGGLTIGAENVQFTVEEIELPAGEEATLEFTNADTSSVSHNVSIYKDEGATKALFQGEVIPGGESISYEIPPQKKGEYHFQCDVHPGMSGTVTVE